MKHIKKILLLLSMFLTLIISCGGGEATKDEVGVTGVTLREMRITVRTDESKRITADISPTNATRKGISWTSANTGVASVDASGLVTGIAEGSTIITATSIDGAFSDTCIVDVSNVVKQKILIILVENNEFNDPVFNGYFDNPATKPAILSLFSNLFGVDAVVLNGLTLSQILDQYGEAKMISSIRNAALGHYDQIIELTDGDASVAEFITRINQFNRIDHSVDIVIDLHSSNNLLVFTGNEEISIDDLIAQINDPLKIRAIYQTCCYGSTTIKEWTEAGVVSANGAVAYNTFVFYSPGLFMSKWIGGKPYGQAVREAYDEEVLLITTLLNFYAPAMTGFIITSEVLDDSRQIVGGDPQLLW